MCCGNKASLSAYRTFSPTACCVHTATVRCPGTAAQAAKRAERLTVSALAALSNFLEAVGEEANAELCVPSAADSTTGFDEDVARSQVCGGVGGTRIHTCVETREMHVHA